MRRSITSATLARHNHEADCWVAVHGNVYDVTAFLSDHPGGAAALSKVGRAGCDVTSHFERIGHSANARKRLGTMIVGPLEGSDTFATVPKSAAHEHEHEHAIEWHASRRRRLLLAHPELADLAGDNCITPVIGLFAAVLHAWLCVQVSTLGLAAAVLLAYTVGAWYAPRHSSLPAL